jgi:hypothetical protein
MMLRPSNLACFLSKRGSQLGLGCAFGSQFEE